MGGLRLALLDPDGPLAPEPGVIDAVDRLPAILRRCDLVEQGRILPDLSRRTQQYATLGGSLDAQTAERMVHAAAESQDGATVGLAAYVQAQTLAPAGALRRALKIAADGFTAAGGSDVECLASRGSCLLVSATSASALGDFDTAREQIKDAGRIADLVDGPTVVAGHTSFSGWNVAMHRVAVEVEARNPSAALMAAEPRRKVKLAQKERVSYFWVDMGRAYSQLARLREALDAFRRAERAAPLRVRLSPVVRDGVRDLVDRAYRRAAGVELRGLAERCGVIPGQ